MTDAPHTLSVCVPNYNGAEVLSRALDALLSQSYRPLEILVLDDGSRDQSLELLEGYEQREPTLRVLRQERNRGALEALLCLIDAARGSHVLFAAVDDVVLPGLFERSMAMLERHPEAGLCSALTRTMDDAGTDRGIFPSPVVAPKPAFIPPTAVPPLLPLGMSGWFVLGNTAVYSLAEVRATAPKCVELGPYFDGFMSQVIALRRGACFIPEPLAYWRVAEESYSGGLRADPGWQRQIADEAHRLMKEDFAGVFPGYYADSWRREEQVRVEVERAAGNAGRLWRELAGRRRHRLPLRPVGAARLRFRLHALRRRRIESRTR